MSKLNTNVRNVLIILVLAAAVAGISGGQTAAAVVRQAVSLGFLAAFAWIGSRLYREHRNALYSLGNQRRTILYSAAGVVVFALTAYDRLTSTGFGTVVFLVLVAGAAYAIYAVYRSMRHY